MLVGICLLVMGLAGCAQSHSEPNLKDIYQARAQYHGPERRPVIVIPGVLGSRLEQTGSGTVVWGAFDGDYSSPNRSFGAQLTALPMQLGVPLSRLRDSVQPAGVLTTLNLNFLFVPLQAQAYAGLIDALGAGGYQDSSLSTVDYGDDHFTCFQFPYDWRRDNVENAARLHEFILAKQEFVRQELERRYGIVEADVKFDLVSHSMGGLLTRYFLRYGSQPLPADGSLPPLTWKGAEYVERAILVGTPNAGSVGALESLLQGSKEAPILPRYAPAIIGTMPSAYQLLPRPHDESVLVGTRKHATAVDPFDPQVWDELNWGLLDPKQSKFLQWLLPDVASPADRRAIALDHVRKSLGNARQFQAALHVPATPPPSLRIHLITGDAVATPSAVRFDPKRRKLVTVRKNAGDGRVTRRSALADHRSPDAMHQELRSPIQWQQVTFIFDDHLGMTSNPQFIDNILYTLLEEPRPPISSGPVLPSRGVAHVDLRRPDSRRSAAVDERPHPAENRIRRRMRVSELDERKREVHNQDP